MMIKGSLLRSVTTVKRFGRKFLSPKMGQKFGFGGLGGEKFNANKQTPIGNQSPPKHVIWRKNGVDLCKIVISSGGQESLKKYKKITQVDLHISPLCRAGPAEPIFIIFGLWFHVTDLITLVKF